MCYHHTWAQMEELLQQDNQSAIFFAFQLECNADKSKAYSWGAWYSPSAPLSLTLLFWCKLLSKYANIFRQPRTPAITNSSRIPGKTGKPFHVYQLQQPSFLTSHNFRTLSTVLFLIEGKSCFRRVLHLHFMRSVSAEALTGAAKACLLQWWEQVWVSCLTSAVSIWHGEEISHHL